MHRTAVPAGRLPRRWRIERLLRKRDSRQRSCHGCAIRRPSPVLRRRLAQIRGTQTVTHGRFASAVHQSIRSAREPAVRPVCVYCLASFAESSTFTASFFVASTFSLPWHLRLQASQRRPSQRWPSAPSPQASSCFRPSPRTQPSCCPSHRSSRSVSQPAVLPVC